MSLLVSPCFAIEFCKDVLEPGNPGGLDSLKTWDEEFPIAGPGDFVIDFWINDVPEPLITAGLMIKYDPTQMSIVSADINESSWDKGMSNTVKDPKGQPPGTVLFTAGNLSLAAPDDDGDIAIASIQFHCMEDCEGEITVSIVPGFDSFVGNSLGVLDSQIDPSTLAIVPPTTTPPTTDYICVPETIYGEHSAETELLRSLRDNVLSKSQEGQELIELYYQWSPLIVRAMESDEEFKQEVKDIVDEVLGVVE
jgi:hypothetical protein